MRRLVLGVRTDWHLAQVGPAVVQSVAIDVIALNAVAGPQAEDFPMEPDGSLPSILDLTPGGIAPRIQVP
jgi:hypothetical protein